MKIITTVVAIIFLLFLAEMKVTFHPFSISFGNLGYVVGMILICIGAGIISGSSERKGYKKGESDYKKLVFEVFDEMEKDKKSETTKH